MAEAVEAVLKDMAFRDPPEPALPRVGLERLTILAQIGIKKTTTKH